MSGSTKLISPPTLLLKSIAKKTERTDEEIIPKEYHDYLDVFNEEKVHRFPESKLWDHKIEMKEGFKPKSFKNYNLTPTEQIEQRIEQIPQRKLGKRLYQTFPITYGISIFLRVKERWKTTTLPGLSVFE